MKIGIKFKLIAFTSSLLLIVILFSIVLVLNGTKNYQDKEAEATLFKQKDMFEQYFSERSSLDEKGSNNEVQLARGNIFNKPWLRTIPASVYNTKGEILSGFNAAGNLKENKEKNVMIQYAVEGKVSSIKVKDVLYFYSPIKYKNSIVAILELKYSVKESNLFYNNIKQMFYGTGLVALILGTILSMLYFLSLTRDIYKMKNSVENIQKGNFHNLQKVNRNDELGELGKGIVFMSNTIEKNIEDLKVERDSLNMAVVKLQKMDKQQKEFIGNVTHEFKTPITTIKAYADLIGMYENDVTLIEEGTLNISKECDRLEIMVDEVLNLSALEKYDFEIQKKEINLKQVFDEICERMMGKIRKNNLTFKYNIENVIVAIDVESLRHIIINLIDNAIKYNKPNGSINVECYKNDNKIIIIVSDTGIGIAKEDMGKIFEPFYRSQSDRSRETGGVGLGLSLVKKLVEKQQGVVKVDSNLNEGSSFYIEFSI